MPLDKLIPQKINVRSPFFITVTDEGAPDLSVDCPVDVSATPIEIPDPTNDPTPQPEYVQPNNLTEQVYCGDTVNIGEDVGVKSYNLNVGTVTGTVTVDYRVNVPISIVGFWNQTVPDFRNTGYVGNSDFEQDLLDAGISAGSMNLASGEQTGTLTITKSAAEPQNVVFVVSAPLPTDDYSLTFNCPAAPAIIADPAPPVSQVLPDPTHERIIENIPAFGIGRKLQGTSVKLEVNGTLVSSDLADGRVHYFSDYNPTTELGMGDGETEMSDKIGLGEYTDAVRYDKSTYFRDGVNEIALTIDPKGSANGGVYKFKFFRTGLFYANSQWNYAEPRSSIQISNEVGFFPTGVNNVNFYKYEIQDTYSIRDRRKKPPFKIKFYYQTDSVEGLVIPSQYSGLSLSNPPANVRGGSFNHEFDAGNYYQVYAEGNVFRWNLFPYGTQSQKK
tara:strand:+ start:56 stop:1390 length:1335 start_codon:yes stop_codon:yes gene_type:complete